MFKGRACARGTSGLVGLHWVVFGVLLLENWVLFFFTFLLERWIWRYGGSWKSRGGIAKQLMIHLAFIPQEFLFFSLTLLSS